MKKIIVSESSFNRVFKTPINEAFDYSSKVLKVKKFLDTHFQKARYEKSGEDGLSQFSPIVIQLDPSGQPTERTLDDRSLFYILQFRFKSILPREERDKFLKQVIKDWYSNKITKYGSLSKYNF